MFIEMKPCPRPSNLEHFGGSWEGAWQALRVLQSLGVLQGLAPGPWQAGRPWEAPERVLGGVRNEGHIASPQGLGYLILRAT